MQTFQTGQDENYSNTRIMCKEKMFRVKINFIKVLSIEITTRGYDLQVEKKKILLLKTRANFTRAFSDLTVSLHCITTKEKKTSEKKRRAKKGGGGRDGGTILRSRK